MEVDEIQNQQQHQQNQPSKLARVGNNKTNYLNDGVEEGEQPPLTKKPHNNSTNISNNGIDVDGANRLRGWHNSSRIVRVSRASGGKDRHSKVWTSKGLRDRRVRLSVTTAIQFYDLQDRLGYDQPSKAVEWLIKAASDAIAELPSLNSPFPETPKQLSDDKKDTDGAEQKQEQEHGFDSVDLEMDRDPSFNNQQGHLSLSKSACSTSTSETSKGSGLSLSRPDVRVNRVKARERARERTAKEKKEGESRVLRHNNVNHNSGISQNATFTELLTGGISTASTATTTHSDSVAANLFTKGIAQRQWALTPMDYFGTQNSTSNFSGQIQLGGNNNTMPHGMSTMSMEQLQQHFSFVPDHNLIPVVAAATTTNTPHSDYNLNFTISSSSNNISPGLNLGAAGFNRGTLQSNSSSPPQPPQHSLLPHLQRFSSQNSSTLDVSTNVPFFIGASQHIMDNHQHPNHHHHHHHHHQFPPGLQLCYGDESRHSDHKGKGKN